MANTRYTSVNYIRFNTSEAKPVFTGKTENGYTLCSRGLVNPLFPNVIIPTGPFTYNVLTDGSII